MSGPKCVGLSATERELMRQDNTLKCDQLLARFRRREHELRRLKQQVEALGLEAVTADVPSTEELRQTVDEAIRVWLDCDALQVLERQLEKIEDAIAQNRLQVEEATFRQLMADQEESPPTATNSDEASTESTSEVISQLPSHGQAKLQDFLQTWRQQRPPSERDLAWRDKLNRLWAQLITTAPEADWTKWKDKVANLSQESDHALRVSHYESLVLEASSHLKDLRQWESQQSHIQHLLEQLSPSQSPSAQELRHQLEEVLTQEIPLLPQQLAAWERETEAELEQETERRRQASRRVAILDSLRELGYEPTAPLETAWVEKGRLILQKPEDTDYAVEIQTDTEVSKLQTVMVRFGEERPLSEQQRLRDLEAEEHWCREHDELLAKLRERGWENTYQFKLAPGEHPVRLVPRESDSPRRETNQNPQARENPPLS